MEDRELTKWTVESALLHADRANKRLFIALVITIFALIVSNAAWIYYESQWEVTEETTTVETSTDGGGDAIGFVGDGNEINYGAN